MSANKPQLVLLHGITASGHAWNSLLPRLSQEFEVFTPHALGHRDGVRVKRSATTFTDVVDAAERYLDTQGLERPHVSGHSMGGYVAIELARRGRASTASAFSPAGFWAADDPIRGDIPHSVRRSVRIARFGKPLVKLAVSSVAGRRFMMGTAMLHPERMSAREARSVIDDHAGCTLAYVLSVPATDCVAPMNSLPCPITIAWAGDDEILPAAKYEAAVRNRIPDAHFVVLPKVGHAAMVDDPDLVIATIIETTGLTR